MRTITAFLLFLLFCNSAVAQFAIVRDKDGYCNVRVQPSTNSKVSDRLANNEVVYCFEKENNWWSVDYGDDGEKHGYIYADRLQLLSELTALVPIDRKPTRLELRKDSLSITITTATFQKSKHKLHYFKDNPTLIEKIDGKLTWGTDGELPKQEYRQIIVKAGATTLNLPANALKNLYNPSLHDTEAFYNKDTDTLYIYAGNSDGAGAYEVLWIVRHGRYVKRLVYHAC
jgi:hypothetical protein